MERSSWNGSVVTSTVVAWRAISSARRVGHVLVAVVAPGLEDVGCGHSLALEVLAAPASVWTVPLLLAPGHHDQVASPLRKSSSASFRRARRSGEGTPLYCAAPITMIAPAGWGSYSREVSQTCTRLDRRSTRGAATTSETENSEDHTEWSDQHHAPRGEPVEGCGEAPSGLVATEDLQRFEQGRADPLPRDRHPDGCLGVAQWPAGLADLDGDPVDSSARPLTRGVGVRRRPQDPTATASSPPMAFCQLSGSMGGPPGRRNPPWPGPR